MDTKKLVVGQNVNMVSNEIYGGTGKVVKVTPEGVEVEVTERTPTLESLMSLQAGKIATKDIQTTDKVKVLLFDNEGNELDVSRRNRLGFGPDSESKMDRVLWACGPEFQPWQLLDDTEKTSH
jgi:YbbR domain-containing protein